MKEVPVVGKVDWKNVEPVAHQIENYMRILRGLDSQDDALATFFGIL